MIASRFISSICLACLGREDGCIHRSGPWIPDLRELEKIREELDLALEDENVS